MNTVPIFEEILSKIANKFINDINIIGEDDVYWENGWNDIGIIFEEKCEEKMLMPMTVFLKELQGSYDFQFKVKSDMVFDEECMTVSIHIPNPNI